MNSCLSRVASLGIAFLISSVSAHAAIAYSNDFETNANGFNLTNRVSLLNASSGSATSMFLGPFNNNAPTLSLTGLFRRHLRPSGLNYVLAPQWTAMNRGP
jgi:opacity protein-like surface antigen